ncbi:Amino acid binding protein [Orobanche minor]
MYADRDYEDHQNNATTQWVTPLVTVEDCMEKGYTVVKISSPDRPQLLFDTVCTLTDMGYVIFHGTIVAEAPQAEQDIEQEIHDIEVEEGFAISLSDEEIALDEASREASSDEDITLDE